MKYYYDIFGNFVSKENKQQNTETSTHNIENFADVSGEVKEAVKQVYQADVEAIRNLSSIATKLQKEGLTIPGHLGVNGRASVGTPDTPATFPEWLSLSVNNNTDSHIRLKTKNDDNKNVYLINRDGHFRVNTHNVGDMLQLNRDGHFYTRHTGDHVAHHEGDGNYPFISLGKTGTWDNKKVYLQNVNAHSDDPTFRVGVHGKAPLMDINRNMTKTPSKMFIGDSDFAGTNDWGVLNIRNRHGSHAGQWSHLNWPDGNNYLRGPTIQDGNLTVNGNINGINILNELNKIPISIDFHVNDINRYSYTYHNDSCVTVLWTSTSDWGRIKDWFATRYNNIGKGWWGRVKILNDFRGAQYIGMTIPVGKVAKFYGWTGEFKEIGPGYYNVIDLGFGPHAMWLGTKENYNDIPNNLILHNQQGM